MDEIKQIDKSLSETLRNSDLKGISEDFAEIAIDAMLNEGVLKEIPILSTILKIGKTFTTVKDQLFLKKIIAFLSQIKDVPQGKRKQMIDTINNSKEQRIKVGEKLIYILDKCDDFIDTQYVAQLFCAFLKEEISYQDFLKGSRIIQNIFVDDLEYFLDNEPLFFTNPITGGIPREEDYPLINAGVLIHIVEPAHETSDDNGNARDELSPGESSVYITSIGEQLKKILKKI